MYEDSASSLFEKPTIIDFEQLCLTQEEDRQVIFEENLQLVDAEGNLLQEVTIAVEDSEEGKGGFVVYQYTHDEDRVLRVQSYVCSNFSTESEVRQIKKMGKTGVLRVTHNDDRYDVFKLVLEGNEGWREKMSYKQSTTNRLVLEGANILVLRKVAMNRLLGQFSGRTIDHEGRLCNCKYEVEDGESGEVVVRRTVIDCDGGDEELTTILTRTGRIKEHQWADCGWRLISLDAKWSSKDDLALQGKGEEEITMETETELKADQEAYFDKKEILMEMMKFYLLDRADVQDMIADFMKNLLFEKPSDVIDYADKFFSEFVGISRDPEQIDKLDEISIPEDIHVTEKIHEPSQRSEGEANTLCSSYGSL